MGDKPSPLRWRLFTLPKRGHSAEEFEDAAAGHAQLGRFAVADGASESAFAGDWARLLVQAYVEAPVGPKTWTEWLPPLQQRWIETIGSRPLAWYAEEKFQQGAFAAFLGLELQPRGESAAWKWRAVAVGDCCVFHIHADRVDARFPIVRSCDFDSTPTLLGSRQRLGNGQPLRDRWKNGVLRPGDTLLCMSDALAQWFLAQCERGQPPWRELRKLTDAADPQTAFDSWTDMLRDRKVMRNDDVTLLALELTEGAPSTADG